MPAKGPQSPWQKLTVKRWTMLGVLVVVVAVMTAAPAFSDERPENAVQQRLAWMQDHQTGMWNVSPREGLYLYNLILKHHLRHGLEIGTSNGYSGIWIASGMRSNHGHLLTLEINTDRADLAEDNFRAAGVEDYVTLQRGDALQEIPKLHGPFDFVFIDAAKTDYVRYLDMVLPLVPPGGVIVAHNVKDLVGELQDFIERVKTSPELKTSFVDPGPGGFSVSVKKRGH